LWPARNIAVVTNDIYTKEDAEFLVRRALFRRIEYAASKRRLPAFGDSRGRFDELEPSRSWRPRTPGSNWFCRERRRHLAAMFSPELVDASIYVIDVAAATDPRKGGPGIKRSGLLVINRSTSRPCRSIARGDDRDARRQRGSCRSCSRISSRERGWTACRVLEGQSRAGDGVGAAFGSSDPAHAH